MKNKIRCECGADELTGTINIIKLEIAARLNEHILISCKGCQRVIIDANSDDNA